MLLLLYWNSLPMLLHRCITWQLKCFTNGPFTLVRLAKDFTFAGNLFYREQNTTLLILLDWILVDC